MISGYMARSPELQDLVGLGLRLWNNEFPEPPMIKALGSQITSRFTMLACISGCRSRLPWLMSFCRNHPQVSPEETPPSASRAENWISSGQCPNAR